MARWTLETAHAAIAAALDARQADRWEAGRALAWLCDRVAAAETVVEALAEAPAAPVPASVADLRADLALWRGRFEGAREITSAALVSAFEAGRLVGIWKGGPPPAQPSADPVAEALGAALDSMKRPPGEPEAPGLEAEAREWAHVVVAAWDLQFFDSARMGAVDPTPEPPRLDSEREVFEAGEWIRGALGEEGRAWLGRDFERGAMLRQLIAEVFEVQIGGGEAAEGGRDG